MKPLDISLPSGIEQLNPMQQTTIDCWRETTHDIVLLSPTGSGKTLAYLLPLLMSLQPGLHEVQAIVISPTRELALQIDQVLKTIPTSFRGMSVYGGRPAMDEHRSLVGIQPAIVIGTPGRLNDHLQKRNINPQGVRYLFIDEFDKCLELGFREEMVQVMQQLPNVKRRMLTSATPLAGEPLGIHCEELDFLQSRQPQIDLYKVQSPQKDKLDTLLHLLCTLGEGQTLVFCNHRESVDRVGAFLRQQRVECAILHGGMDQESREKALYRFRNGSAPVMVSTDLAARGIDVLGIDNVVHYHLPLQEAHFIHRNGRTARYGARGNAFVLLGPDEQFTFATNDAIADYDFGTRRTHLPVPRYVTLYIGKGKKDKLGKGDVVGFLCKQGGLKGDEIGQVDVKDHHCYVAVDKNKVAQTLKLIHNEKIKGIKTIIEIAK